MLATIDHMIGSVTPLTLGLIRILLFAEGLLIDHFKSTTVIVLIDHRS